MKALFIFLSLLAIAFQQSFDSFKLSMEEKVKKLASDMSEIYAQRCNDNILQCQIKSYNRCLGTSAHQCFTDFPKPDGCLSDGAYLSTQSAIRFPNNVNAYDLSDEQKHFVCTSAVLEDSFKELDNGRNQQYGIAYIGTSFGSFRSYPTFKQVDEDDFCVDYDPRYRPWYVSAASGGKNVILIIDISGSMEGSRMITAQEAAKSVINTLSNNDFLGVVQFSSGATYMVSENLTRATSQHKSNLINEISGLVANGMTNYESAFKLGFSMLKSAQSDEFGSPCANSENIFLFLTDGEPTLGANTSAQLISVINEYNTDFNITLFTYGLGSGIDVSILKSLACEYHGILFEVQDSSSSSELTNLMRSYYIYVSQGISIENPIWTEPYDDFFGFGRMVTVSMPIYYTENGIRTLLGVSGIDVVLTTFEKFGIEDEVQITRKLISDTPCLKSSLSACDLEALRPLSSQCGEIGCTFNGSFDNCSGTTTSDIFLDPISEESNLCCGGMTTGALIGIIVPIVIVLAIAIGCIAYKVKKSRVSEALRNPNFNKEKNNPHNSSNMQMNQNMNLNNSPHLMNQYPPQYNNPYTAPAPYIQ